MSPLPDASSPAKAGRGAALVRGVAGGGAAAAGLGMVDASALLFSTDATYAGTDAWVLLFVGASALVPFGALFGATVGWVRHLLPNAPKLYAAMGPPAFAFALADRFVQVNYYPWAHGMLAAAAFGLAVVGAVWWTPAKFARPAALAAGVLALAGALVGPRALGSAPAARALALAQPTVLSRAIWWWPHEASESVPETREGNEVACEFPPARAVPVDESPRPPYNVLILSVDALRGELGGPGLGESMPEVAKALGPARHYLNAYAAGTRTTESTYSMLTGRWPHRLKFTPSVRTGEGGFRVLADDDPDVLDPGSWRQHHPLPLEDPHPSIGRVFKEAGYTSVAVVGSMFLLEAAGITDDFGQVRSGPFDRRSHERDEATSPLIADELVSLLEELPANEPWLVWAHFLDPHAPYTAREPAAEGQVDPIRYLSEVRFTSKELARVLEAMRAREDAGRTVVVFTSDHGEEFRDHGGRFHGATVYRELAWVPLSIAVPGEPGALVEAPVSLVDLAPTLVSLTGVQSEVEFDGRAVWKDAPAERPLLTESTLNGRRLAIVVGSDKLTLDVERGVEQLFDLAADPQERTNRVGEDSATRERLLCLLEASGALATAP